MASRTLDDLGGEKQLQRPRQQLQDSTGISRRRKTTTAAPATTTGFNRNQQAGHCDTTKVFPKHQAPTQKWLPAPQQYRRGNIIGVISASLQQYRRGNIIKVISAKVSHSKREPTRFTRGEGDLRKFEEHNKL